MAWRFNPFTNKLDKYHSTTELDALYLNLSGGNANQNINIGTYNFTITGTLGAGAITGTNLTDSAMTLGSVLFAGTAGIISQNTTAGQQLFWDNTNYRLGIGTSTPGSSLSVQGTINVGQIGAGNNILTASDGNPGDTILTLSRQAGNIIQFDPYYTGGFNLNNSVGIKQAPLSGYALMVNGELAGDPFSDQRTYELAGQFLDVLTDPKCLFGWLTPSDAGTEQDLSPSNHDATYTDASDWTTSDQLHKGFVWTLDFDGTNDYLTLGDHDDFSFGNSLVDSAFSVGGWIQVVDGGWQSIITKWDDTGNAREWALFISDTEKPDFYLFDESLDKQPHRITNSAVNVGWHFIVVTYDGTGGATAANGITFYVDGVSVASTATNDAAYVAMENLGASVEVGAYLVSSLPFIGDMGMVFITKEKLTANDVWSLYIRTRGFYNQ